MDNSTDSDLPVFVATTLPSKANFSEAYLGKGFDAEAIFKIFVLSVVALFGTLGNILVIVTIRKERKLRIPGNFFITNLAITDIIITAMGIPVIIYNLASELTAESLEGYFISVQRGGFCQTTAYLKVIALHVSWYSLAFIALNRYYTVCRTDEYATHFTKNRLLVTIFLIWIWVFLINLPIMVGWAVPNDKELKENSTEGHYFSYPRHGPPVVYDRSSHDCVLGVDDYGGYTYANGFFVMSIPLVAIIFCYALVYMEIVQSRRRMKSALNPKQLQRRYKKERKISIMLAVVVVVFILCWTPVIIYDFTSNIDQSTNVEDKARLVFSWMALSNSAMNPPLYALMSKAFRIGFKKVLSSVLRRFLCGRCAHISIKSISESTTSDTKSTFHKVFPRRIRKNRRDAPKESYAFRSRADNSEYNETSVGAFEEKNLGRQNTKKKRGNDIISTRLTVPGTNGRGRSSSIPHGFVVEISQISTSQDISSDPQKKISDFSTNENTKIAAQISTHVTTENSEKTATAQHKKTFIPLLQQLDDSGDAFTEAGIYLGCSPKKRRSVKGPAKTSQKDKSSQSTM